MQKYNVCIVMIILFVLTACTPTPEPLNLAACDLEVKFGDPANNTFQCGAPVTLVAHVLNRSSELCRRGSIGLVRNGESGAEERVGSSQIVPRLEGGQQLTFDFLEQEIIRGEVNYTVAVANGLDVVLPPEDFVALDPGVVDGFEENNTQARIINYDLPVLWQEIEDLLGVAQPTVAPANHPHGVVDYYPLIPEQSDIKALLDAAGKDNCVDCHTETNWGTPAGQSPLTAAVNGERTHPEGQEPDINCLQCHTPGTGGSDEWASGSWQDLPDEVSCTTCHGDVLHAWHDFQLPGVWALAVEESTSLKTHPGEEIWINIVKRWAICGDQVD